MNGKKQALKGLAFRLISLLENTVSKTLEVKSKVFAFKSSRAVQANLQLGTQA